MPSVETNDDSCREMVSGAIQCIFGLLAAIRCDVKLEPNQWNRDIDLRIFSIAITRLDYFGIRFLYQSLITGAVFCIREPL